MNTEQEFKTKIRMLELELENARQAYTIWQQQQIIVNLKKDVGQTSAIQEISEYDKAKTMRPELFEYLCKFPDESDSSISKALHISTNTIAKYRKIWGMPNQYFKEKKIPSLLDKLPDDDVLKYRVQNGLVEVLSDE